jgi:hypothetical protein
MLTVAMPTIVSRMPQALMLSADGFAERVRTMRTMAAAMTNAPEERSSPMTSFLSLLVKSWMSGVGAYLCQGTWSFQRRGSGMQRMRPSVL